jgi:tetratricopeptide (TPR) repeat protein
MAAPTTWAAGAPAATSALSVHVAQAKDFSRIEFRWAGKAAYKTRREGQKLFVSFSRDAKPDVAELKVLPPKWVSGVEVTHPAGAIEFVFTLADNADAKLGFADGATYLNVFEAAEAEVPAEAGSAVPKPEDPAQTEHAEATSVKPRENPVPLLGTVGIGREDGDAKTALTFKWRAPLGAAVFRRGDAVWIVFDAVAGYDLGKLKNASHVTGYRLVKGDGWSGVRLDVQPTTVVAAVGEGPNWTVTLSSKPLHRVSQIEIKRDGNSGVQELQAVVAGASSAIWIDDPVVGDRMAVVPALAPSKGVTDRRQFVDMTLLASAQGLALEVMSPATTVTAEGDLVHIAKPAGLALSPQSDVEERLRAENGFPQPASMPGLIGDDWGKTGEGGFLKRYDTILQAVAAEESAEHDEAGSGKVPSDSRMALARFLIGSNMAYEAIGVLNDLARSQQEMLGKAEFRGLRGMARTMVGRYKEAEADFSSPVLTGDPSTQLWRAYGAAKQGLWSEAHQKFMDGELALGANDPLWRARFQIAASEAALRTGDIPGAQTLIISALAESIPDEDQLAARLVQAHILEAQDQPDRALKIYKAIANAPLDDLAAEAMLRATRIQFDRGQLKPADAANIYDGLRYRWRGDATELETIRALGQLYLSQGRYREALEVLRSAGSRLPDLPEAAQVQNDLSSAFKSLFLDGTADGLQPIQALGLFFDFKELTPVGADGDLMVRKLVRRLVDVDLLDQAASLLKYQVDNRLEGVPKAQVATQLATIYLMGRQPESALQAINSSRNTLLPATLNAERRIVTARALAALGRLDAAKEIIETDKTPEGRDVQADIAWRGHDWTASGSLYESGLGERWKNPAPLTQDEEGRLLRAGVSYSLAGDDPSLQRLNTRFGGFIEKARNPEALRIALQEMGGEGALSSDLGRLRADSDAFAGWVSRMKQRFRDKASPTPAVPVRSAAAKPAPTAAPPPKKG